MTTLDKQWSAICKVQSLDETTLDQVLSRIAALAPMVARLAPDIEQGRRLPAELVSALKSAGIYGVTAALNLTRRAAFGRSRPWPGSMGRWAGMP